MGRQSARLLVVASAIFPSIAFASDQISPVSGAVEIAGPVLMVSDLERSLRFYTEGLGMTVASRLPGNPGPGAVIVGSAKQASFLLLRQRSPEARLPAVTKSSSGLSRIMLTVPEPAAVAARLRAAGYGIPDPNSRHIFFVTDPDGYRYEVMASAGPR